MLFGGVHLCALCFVIKCVSLLEITRANYGHVEDDVNSSIVYHHVSLSECIRMCTMRPWCKGVGYQQRVQICMLYPDFSITSTGPQRSKREMVLIGKKDILFPEVGRCDALCSFNNDVLTTCDLNTKTCKKEDCFPLVAELGEDIEGNLNTEGSKRAFVCDPGFLQIGRHYGQCLNGQWTMIPLCAKRNGGLTISVFESRVAMESGTGTDCGTFSGPPKDSSKHVNIMCRKPVIGRVVRILQQNQEPSPMTLCEVTLIGPGLMQ